MADEVRGADGGRVHRLMRAQFVIRDEVGQHVQVVARTSVGPPTGRRRRGQAQVHSLRPRVRGGGGDSTKRKRAHEANVRVARRSLPDLGLVAGSGHDVSTSLTIEPTALADADDIMPNVLVRISVAS